MTGPLLLLSLLLFTGPALIRTAWADGGRLRLHEPAGPFIVTLFTSPDPLAQGRADFSVAVERAGGQGAAPELVRDARVTLILTPEGAAGPPGREQLVLPASHAAATSALLQAANFTLPHPGVWKITVKVQQGGAAGECSEEIDVLPYRVTADETAWEIAVVPLAILLFGVHQALKARRRRSLRSR